MIKDNTKKNNLKPSNIEITTKIKKSYVEPVRYKSFPKQEKKNKNQEKYISEKQMLNLNIKNIKGKMDNLKQSSESLIEKFVKRVNDAENSPNASVLIFEANLWKRKSEE